MTGRKKHWSELSPRTRALVVALGAVELGLLAAALTDISRRPAAEINGSKAKWVAISFINILGPLAYFKKGRRV